MSTIAAVIPTLGESGVLQACIESLLMQTRPPDEIILIDNGSNRCISQVTAWFPCAGIRIIVLQNNVGFGRAVNLGIESSISNLVLVLNDDTILDPGCIEELRTAADRCGGFSFFAPLILDPDNPPYTYAAGLMFSDRGYGNRSNRHELHGTSVPREVMGACGAAALFRRNVLEEVGLFNERFFLMYEDQELSLRHRLLGHKCLLVPSAVVHHLGSATLRNHFTLAVCENVKNSVATLLTCAPREYIARYGVRIVAFYVRLFAGLVKSGYAPEVVRGVRALCSMLPWIQQRRSELHARSRLTFSEFDSLLYRGPIEINLPGGRLVL